MCKYFALLLIFLLLSCSKSSDDIYPHKITITPLDEYLVYEDGKHNAFTDLCKYDNKFYLSFRNASNHITANDYGQIIIMESHDGIEWKYLFTVAEEGCDLRDPKLIVDSFGYLNLYCGYSMDITPDIVGSKAGRIDISSKSVKLLNICDNKWLWSVTWYNNVAYSVAYDKDGVYFLKSKDGYDWEEFFEYNEIVCNEASLAFISGHAQVVLRIASQQNTLIGHADTPYLDWTFTEIPQVIQSPKLLPLMNGEYLLAGRMIENNTKQRTCALLKLNNSVITDTIWMSNSAIDIAYPGICTKDNNIYLSFYSGDWESANIYVKKFSMSYLE